MRSPLDRGARGPIRTPPTPRSRAFYVPSEERARDDERSERRSGRGWSSAAGAGASSTPTEELGAPSAPASPSPNRERWIRLRVLVAGLPLLLLFPVLARKAHELQVQKGSDFRGLAQDQYLRDMKLSAPRGTIYDRGGQPLAISVDVESAFANPRQLLDPADAARRISSVLRLPYGKLHARLSKKSYFAWLKRRLTPDEASGLRKLGLPGVATTLESRRFYPNRDLAGALIGFAGQDGSGLEGIEKQLDKMLTGRPASLRGLRDAQNRPILPDGLGPRGSAAARSAVAGYDVVLTIDRAIQHHAERVLADTVTQFNARGAVAVVMEPRTGAILALAQAPSFDPNQAEQLALPGDAGRGKAAARAAVPSKLRGITDVFEPGSTFKVFLMGAALEAGVVKPEETIDTENGRMRIGKHTIHDTHPYKTLTATELITKSSNIGSAKLGMRLGKQRFYDYLQRFGFGLRSEVELPGEIGGILHQPRRWSDIGLANIAFGQGVAVTALQLCNALSAIANGGTLMRPRIVERIVEHGSSNNRAVGAYPPEIRGRVLSEKNARIVAAMMRTVTTKDGTAKQAALPGYGVAGKTGTAQKADPVSGGYGAGLWVSSFVGFVPASDPRLAMVVIVDEPRTEHLGGLVAAPAFRLIAEEALKYLGVPHSEPLEPPTRKPGAAGSKAPTSAAAEPPPPMLEAPLDPATAPVTRGQVPSFTGLTLRESLQLAARAGLSLQVEGAGTVIGQDPAPGSEGKKVLLRLQSGTSAGTVRRGEAGTEAGAADGRAAAGAPVAGQPAAPGSPSEETP